MSDIHALSGAFAIDALDEVERAQFARHLDQCVQCQAEVAGLREAAALLAETTAVEPPAALRERVLAGIGTVRPLPPLTTARPVPAAGGQASGPPDGPADETADDSPTGSPTDADADTDTDTGGTAESRAGAAPVSPPPVRTGEVEPDRVATRRIRPAAARPERRWLRGLAAAAAVVAVLGAGGVVWDQTRDDTSQTQPTAADRVRNAPDAVTSTQRLEAGGEATVIASKSQNRVVVITRDLPPLPKGTIYEMWLNDADKGMVPAGLMTAEDATVVLEGDVANAVGAGITIEPAGGSEVPTSDPIVEFSFEEA